MIRNNTAELIKPPAQKPNQPKTLVSPRPSFYPAYFIPSLFFMPSRRWHHYYHA